MAKRKISSKMAFYYGAVGEPTPPRIQIDLGDRDIQLLDTAKLNDRVQVVLKGKISAIRNDSGRSAGLSGSIGIDVDDMELDSPNEYEELSEDD